MELNKILSELDQEIKIGRASLQSLKGKGFIYILYNYDAVVYVGQSNDLGKRIYTHTTTTKFTHFIYKEVAVDFLDLVEAELIVKYQPKQNKTIPTNDRYVSLPKLCEAIKAAFPASNWSGLKNLLGNFAKPIYQTENFQYYDAQSIIKVLQEIKSL